MSDLEKKMRKSEENEPLLSTAGVLFSVPCEWFDLCPIFTRVFAVWPVSWKEGNHKNNKAIIEAGSKSEGHFPLLLYFYSITDAI